MSRRRKHRSDDHGRTPEATHWIWAGILAVLAGGVFYSFQTGIPVGISASESSSIENPVKAIETVATSTIRLGIAVPKADRDQVYTLSLPSKTIEQQIVDKGWRLDQWKKSESLHMIPASPDGKAPVLTDGKEWNVSLRGANGEAYAEPQIVGMADDTHAFVIATTDARKLLLVSRSGEIRSIFDVPEFANIFLSGEGHIWIATFVPGEGIESEPMGPSQLIRVSLSGIQEKIAEETRVIIGVVPGTDGGTAYRTDDGDVVAMSLGKRWSGNGIPLLWLDQDRLLLAQGRGVFLLDMRSLTLDLLQQLPAAASAAFML